MSVHRLCAVPVEASRGRQIPPELDIERVVSHHVGACHLSGLTHCLKINLKNSLVFSDHDGSSLENDNEREQSNLGP